MFSAQLALSFCNTSVISGDPYISVDWSARADPRVDQAPSRTGWPYPCRLAPSPSNDSEMSFTGVPASLRFIRRPEILKERAVGNLLDAGFAYSRSSVTSANTRYDINL